MKELDAEAAALGMIASGQIPPDSMSLQARAIASSANSALKAFEQKSPRRRGKAGGMDEMGGFLEAHANVCAKNRGNG